jgi:hypothetical protein
MTSRTRPLPSEALALPVEDRAGAAAEGACAREIERRAWRVMAGDSAGEPWDDARLRIERGLAAE